MKLKKEFVTYEVDRELVMMPMGKTDFHGLVRTNSTAAFIVRLLKKETDKAAIVKAMRAEFDASEEQISGDVDAVLDKLRSIGALDE